MQSIPIINVSAHASAASLGQALGRAARDIGFFVLTDHGIEATLIADAFAQSQRFFSLNANEKIKLSIKHSPHNRGYVGMMEEQLDPSKPGDVKEAFNIGWDLAIDHPDVLAGEPFRGVNVWPDLQHFRETMLDYFNACHTLGVRLHRALAHDLDVEENFFDQRLDAPLATLRLLHYPPRTATFAAGQMGAGVHTDYGNLTLLATDDAGGLEVQARDGTWIAPPHVPNALIVNIGDCLMRWTNDVYVSTPHRVVNPLGRERYSIAFFLDANPHAIVDALPSCVSAERPKKYPAIGCAEYIKSRLDATYAHRNA